MIDVQELITKLSKAISYKYPGTCAPSLLISNLPNGNFYVSILKYGATHRDKQVMHKAIDADLGRALDCVMQQFLAGCGTAPNPVDELRALANRIEAVKREAERKSTPPLWERIIDPNIRF